MAAYDVFRALADPSRRALLDRLNERNGQTLRELCAGLDMARQSVSKHLDILEAANLVTTVRSGREKLHYLNPVPIQEIYERWIGKFERGRLQALSDLKRRLEGSNVFGSSEYYFGIISGVIRYFCIVLFFMALLNAPVYSKAELAAQQAYNNRWYGGGLKDYKGDFIPTLNELQVSVFVNSLTGPFIKDWFSLLLINTIPPGGLTKPPVIDIQH